MHRPLSTSPGARPRRSRFAEQFGREPVEEVANVIADVIDHPVAEIYTRPQMRELAARYFAAEGVSEIERQPPFMPVRR